MTYVVERLSELRRHLEHLLELRPGVPDRAALERDLSLHNDVLFSLLMVCQLVIDIAAELAARRGIASRFGKGQPPGAPASVLWKTAGARRWQVPGPGVERGGGHGVPRPCDDDLDNDADTFSDHPSDPGCSAKTDLSEGSPLLVCDDDVDNDGDGYEDYPDDPGCRYPGSTRENPKCQDGQDNDSDGAVDFDGGASIHGIPIGAPDPQCTLFWLNREIPYTRSTCGLGYELAPALALLAWLRARHRRRR
jgi:hypothetical protein